MPSRKITEYAALTTPASDDVLPIIDVSEAAASDQNKKITIPSLTSQLSAATTSAAGIVQLSSATNSTSTTLAATASAVKAAYDLAAKAWVNFNGTGTVAIRASANVSSITDNGVGDYIVNFTTPLADANYSLVASSTFGSANGFAGTAPTASAARVSSYTTTTGAALDSAFICVAVFR
jgi:hypothetical protein